jgi:hypothetical protein
MHPIRRIVRSAGRFYVVLSALVLCQAHHPCVLAMRAGTVKRCGLARDEL